MKKTQKKKKKAEQEQPERRREENQERAVARGGEKTWPGRHVLLTDSARWELRLYYWNEK